MATSMGRRLCPFILRRRTHFLYRLASRSLLSDSDIKIEGYMRQRIFKTDQLGYAGKVSLLRKLKEVKTSTDARHASFGLTDLIHVAESDSEVSELERLFRLISVHDRSELESFAFGASLMRLYHHLGWPDRAYALYKDPACWNLLNDNTCHKVLMDLLYNHKQYERVLDVYSGLQNFNIDCVTLAFGAHYQINTLESFMASQELLKHLLQHHSLSRRTLLYAAMLALNQNYPTAALETLNMCREGVLVLNLRLMCHAQLGHIQVLKALQDARDKSEDITKPLNVRIYSDTMKAIQESVVNIGSENDSRELLQLEQDLAARGVLSRQLVTILLDRKILGDVNYRKESGKHKIMRR